MGIHAGIYMAAAILSAPVLTAGGGQSQANGNGQTAAVQTESSVSYGESAVSGKPVNVSFDAPQQSGSGEAGNQMENKTDTAAASAQAGTADASRFVLPEEARVLVIVEGTGGTGCNVYAFERSSAAGIWEKRLETTGHLGMNGMSNHRHSGDKTTPIGVFKMNTPFGQATALEGFP